MKTQWLGAFLLFLPAALVSVTAYAENWKLWSADDNTYIDLDSIEISTVVFEIPSNVRRVDIKRVHGVKENPRHSVYRIAYSITRYAFDCRLHRTHTDSYAFYGADDKLLDRSPGDDDSYWLSGRSDELEKFICSYKADTARGTEQTQTVVQIRISSVTCMVGKLNISCSDVGAELLKLGMPPDADIHVRGDAQASYSAVSAALESLRSAGFKFKVGYYVSAE